MSIKPFLNLRTLCLLMLSSNIVLAQDQPQVKLSPNALDFKNQEVKATSAEKTVTLRNTGNADMKAIGVLFAGDHKSDFKKADTSTCLSTLAAGKSCQIKVTFTPRAEGERSATLTITSGANSSPDEISLKGTGIVLLPVVKLSPNTLDFKNQEVKVTSAEKSISVTNTGKAELSNIRLRINGDHRSDFTQIDTSTCGNTLAAGESCQINFTFTPRAEGERSATLTITSNAESSPDEMSLKGTGEIYQAAVKLSPNPLDFSNQGIRLTSAEKTITLGNTGKAELSNIRTQISGEHKSDFAVAADTSTCGKTLAAGESCQINFTFTPRAEGERSATLTVFSNAESSPDEISLKGIGEIYQPAVQLSLNTLDFENQTVKETSRVQTITLKNTGKAELSSIRLVTEGEQKRDFNVLNSSTCEKTLAAGANCRIKVTFTPKVTGNSKATLSIISSAESSPDKITMKGRGVEDKEPNTTPSVRLSPSPLDFGNHAVNVASDIQTITVTNQGAGLLRNLDITIEGLQDEFGTPSSTCRTTLAARDECTIDIVFTPKATGARSATLTITSSAASSPDTLTLTGIGIASDEPIVRLMPSSLNFRKQTLFQSSRVQTVTFINSGLVELDDIDLTIEGEHADDFALEESTTCDQTLAAEESCEIDITFTPTAEGSRTATLMVGSHATSSPDMVPLEGVGEAGLLQYPSLGNGFALDSKGNPLETGVTFSGGAALLDENGEWNGSEFKTALDIRSNQPFLVRGTISDIEEQDVGKNADILVVGFFVRETDQDGNPLLKNDNASIENCDATLLKSASEGGYYMKVENHFEYWNGQELLKAYQTVSLPETVMLSEDNGNPIYKGPPPGAGHICVYFGYWLTPPEGDLVFNGFVPINIRIRE